ncbi:MAG: DUF4038 domain-containing protein, partial [Chloroflexota bacterium]|nr:DUF4038 domain-containing protein [Chloroflexota bacterium]
MRWLEGAPSTAGSVLEWDVPLAPPAAESSPALVREGVVRLESPSGRMLVLPAFRGSESWRARARADEPGTWRWSIAGSGGDGDSSDGDGGGDGTFAVSPAPPGERSGGPLRVAASGRHLETQRGEPFFYLGDTAWFVTFKGAPPDWERYLDRRAAQGYSVVQIQLLPFQWETPDPEGHLPFVDDDLGRPNEPYFARVDRFCALAAARGLYVLLALMWGGNRPGLAGSHFSTAQAVDFARYAVARYAAFPVLWSLSGDAPYVQEAEKWDAVGAAVEDTDPYRHPTTNHLPPTMNWHFLHHGAAWHDFHMLQTGHRRGNTPDVAALPAAYSRHAAAKPVVNGEPWYERHPQMDGWHERARQPGSPPSYGEPFSAVDARYAFWTSVLGGATMG